MYLVEFEGFGLVVGEVLVYGLFVVGFVDCSGFNYLVCDGENGVYVLVIVDWVVVLSDVLCYLMDVLDECVWLGKNGLVLVECFDFVNVLLCWLILIEKGWE